DHAEPEQPLDHEPGNAEHQPDNDQCAHDLPEHATTLLSPVTSPACPTTARSRPCQPQLSGKTQGSCATERRYGPISSPGSRRPKPSKPTRGGSRNHHTGRTCTGHRR